MTELTPRSHEVELVQTQIDSLVYDPANPRNHSEKNLKAIRSSLEEHGQVEPLIVHKESNVVIGGNARLSVMREMGWADVATVMLDCDKEKARKLSIVLNRSGELAGWDQAVLAQHLLDLGLGDEFDPETLGFSTAEFEAILAEFDAAVENMEMGPPGELDIPDTPEFADDEGGPGPSNVRMLQLYLDDETHPKFVAWVRSLAEHYGTENITETVYKAVEDMAHQVAQ